MAASEEEPCSITDATLLSEKNPSRQTTSTPSLELGEPSSPSRPEALSERLIQEGMVENGSVLVADHHMNPTFNSVETSATDSGVSNTSSMTSDCVPHLTGEVPMEVGLSTRRRHRKSGSTEAEDSERGGREGGGGGICTNVGEVVSLQALTRKERGEGEEATDVFIQLTHDLEGLKLSKSLEDTSGRNSGGTDKVGKSIQYTSSIESSGVQSYPPPCVRPALSSLVDPASRASLTDQLSPLNSYNSNVSEGTVSEGTISLDSSVILETKSGSRPGSSSSLGAPPRGLSPLLAVFNRSQRKKLSYVGAVDSSSQGMLAASSTTGLILEARPKTLPAKSVVEEKRHQKLYEEMVAAARKKELQKAKEAVKREKQRRQKDKMMADSLKEWGRVLPNWEALSGSRKVRELWWLGLPPGVRGKVWKKAIGNDLSISPELYQISLSRCREKLAFIQSRPRSDSVLSQKGINREQSVEVIHLDVLRTFPTLGFFQEGGPYNQTLHDVLGAYACYRPDVGYVQGMSFLAAVLLLNMDACDAFVAMTNLLNRPSYLAFFRVDHELMQPYFNAFTCLLHETLPHLSAHFTLLEFTPEFYLIEWIFTLYTRTLPLDVACRVWDMFCRDGDCFLFRTALGLLRMFQPSILHRTTIEEVGQFLGALPDDIDSDVLFQHIAAINLNAKKFMQLVQQHS